MADGHPDLPHDKPVFLQRRLETARLAADLVDPDMAREAQPAGRLGRQHGCRDTATRLTGCLCGPDFVHVAVDDAMQPPGLLCSDRQTEGRCARAGNLITDLPAEVVMADTAGDSDDLP